MDEQLEDPSRKRARMLNRSFKDIVGAGVVLSEAEKVRFAKELSPYIQYVPRERPVPSSSAGMGIMDIVRRLRQEKKQLEADIDELREEEMSSLQENMSLQSQIEGQTASLAELEAQRRAAQDEVAVLREQVSASRQELAEAAAASAALSAQIGGLQAAQAATVAQLQQTQAAQGATSAQLQQAQAKLQGLLAQSQQLQAELQAKEGELEELRGRASQASGEVQAQTQVLQELNAVAADLASVSCTLFLSTLRASEGVDVITSAFEIMADRMMRSTTFWKNLPAGAFLPVDASTRGRQPMAGYVRSRKLYIEMENLFYLQPMSKMMCLKQSMQQLLSNLPEDTVSSTDSVNCRTAFELVDAMEKNFAAVRKATLDAMYEQVKSITRSVIEGVSVAEGENILGAQTLVALDDTLENQETLRETLFNLHSQFNIPQKIVGLTTQTYFKSVEPKPPLSETLDAIMDSYISSLYPAGRSATESMQEATTAERLKRDANERRAKQCTTESASAAGESSDTPAAQGNDDDSEGTQQTRRARTAPRPPSVSP